MLSLAAPAKINLSLEILGKRADGFHDLVSVMQTVSLADTLDFDSSSTLSLTCSDARLSGERNLAFQAAKVFAKRFKVRRGCHIHVHKVIPSPAGLGGGSSDAAAALRGLNAFWNVDAPHATLVELAAELGSDVPFFLTGGTALVRGRGEQVLPLPRPEPVHYVLVRPDVALSTREVYARVASRDYSSGVATHRLAATIENGGPAHPVTNGLQRVACEISPGVTRTIQLLSSRVSSNRVLLCGSGATVLAMVESEAEGRNVLRAIPEGYGWRTLVVAVGSSEGEGT